MKKAGAEGLTVDLVTADSALELLICALYTRSAKAAVNINVGRVPSDGYYSDMARGSMVRSSVGCKTYSDVMYSLHKDDASWNESRWKHPQFNVLLRQAKAELDDVKRAGMYRNVKLRTQGGTVIPFFPNFVYARRKGLEHGPNLAPSWQMDGARASQRWWFS